MLGVHELPRRNGEEGGWIQTFYHVEQFNLVVSNNPGLRLLPTTRAFMDI